MPGLSIQGGDIRLPRNVALLDTNILVAMFDDSDQLHDNATLTLEDDLRFEWVVMGPVLVEACGLLGKRKGADAVLTMLLWLITPGNRVSVITCGEGPNEHELRLSAQREVMAARRIDFVDAYLMRTATLLSVALGVSENPVPIVTSDLRDYFSAISTGYRYSVLNWQELESEVIPIMGA